jgi:hypothetical protein
MKLYLLAGGETTVVQGIDNGKHQLKLSGKGLKDLQAVRVYEPALK